ncbi:MAG: hypothetical protein DRO18_06940 [Thermoprotei archaeon]|nr:MAG: hypothetical protein DRO18_06940 [Thermoprotei archaeon]
MIKGIRLRNFRGVIKGDLRLSPLTILIGPNNSGKTTILEALLLLHGLNRDIAGIYSLDVSSRLHRVLKSEGLDYLIYGYGAKVKNAVITYLIRDKYRHIAIYVDGKHVLFYFVLGNNQDLTDKLLNADPDVLKSMGNKIARINRFSASGGFNPFRLCNVLFVMIGLGIITIITFIGCGLT